MRKHILLIDDDVVDRLVLATILRRARYRVTTASHVRVALEHLGSFIPDLILLDMLMPEKTGWDFLLAREELASLFAVPVLVVTGLSVPEMTVGQTPRRRGRHPQAH